MIYQSIYFLPLSLTPRELILKLLNPPFLIVKNLKKLFYVLVGNTPLLYYLSIYMQTYTTTLFFLSSWGSINLSISYLCPWPPESWSSSSWILLFLLLRIGRNCLISSSSLFNCSLLKSSASSRALLKNHLQIILKEDYY